MPTPFDSVNNGDPTDAAQLNQFIEPIQALENGVSQWGGLTGGVANGYSATLDPEPPATLPAGFTVRVKIHVANTGASTLSLNGAAGIAIQQNAAALSGGELPLNSTKTFTYDGAAFQLQARSLTAADIPSIPASKITTGQVGLARGGTGADLSATGGAGQVLKQSTSGGAVSVGALSASDMPSGIDAAKIGGGAVSNTEFGYLDGVTSAIQTQLGGKAATSHTHAAADIASGQVGLARGGTGADLSATGGAGQVLKQSTSGGAVSVGALSASDMPTGISPAKIGAGCFSARVNADLAVGADTLTAARWGNQLLNTIGFTLSNNDSRITIPTPGTYSLQFGLSLDIDFTSLVVGFYVTINGGVQFSTSTTAIGRQFLQSPRLIYPLSTGDYIEAAVYCDDGTLNILKFDVATGTWGSWASIVLEGA